MFSYGQKDFHRGDIYFCDFVEQGGSVQSGLRPALIIRNNMGNKYSSTLIVSPITSIVKKATLEYAVSGDNDTLNRYNIELNIKQLQSEADMLMERAANTEGDTERYFTEIEKLYDKIKILRQRLEMLQSNVNVQNSTDVEVKRIAEILEKEDISFTEFDDGVIRRIVECIRVMGDKSIAVILKGGFEMVDFIE